MTEKNIPHQTIEKFIALENLYSLCLDDSWLMDFIQDTEDHRMVKAPAHMKEETLKQITPPLFLRVRGEFPSRHNCTKR